MRQQESQNILQRLTATVVVVVLFALVMMPSTSGQVFACDHHIGCSHGEGNHTANVQPTTEESDTVYSISKSVWVFSTNVVFSLHTKDAAVGAGMEKTFGEMVAFMTKLNDLADLKNATGDIARFNALNSGESVVVDPLTTELLLQAKKLFEETNGAFNPASYMLADLWQLSSRYFQNTTDDWEKMPYETDKDTLPEQKYITAFSALSDFSLVAIDEKTNTVTKNSPSVTVDGVVYQQKIDLGGIAKGFAIDKMKKMAQDAGINDGHISAGGSSVAVLGGKVDINLTNDIYFFDPVSEGAVFASVKGVENTNVTSSGDYVRYREVDGVRYSHIIDTAKGAPVQTGLNSVTIIGGSGAAGDALSTAFSVMSLQNAIKFMQSEFIKGQDMKVVLHYQRDVNGTEHKEVIMNVDKQYIEMVADDVHLAGYLNENGEIVYLPATTQSPPLSEGWLIAIIIVGFFSVVALVQLMVKSAKKKKDKNLNLKFFRPFDIVVYTAMTALVLVLLITFVFSGGGTGDLDKVDIYIRNEVVFTIDMNTGNYRVTKGFEDSVTVEEKDGETFVTIKTPGHTNVVQIGKVHTIMAEADCSASKICVENFEPITKSGQVIVCNVTGIKVVGVAAVAGGEA